MGFEFVKGLLDDTHERTRRSAAIAAGGIQDSNKIGVIQNIAGGRGEQLAAGNLAALRAEVEELESKKRTSGALPPNSRMDMFKAGMKEHLGVTSLFGIEMETDADRGERENDEKLAQKKNTLKLAGAQARQKFESGVGGMELERSKALAEGHLKQARALENVIGWQQKYDEIKDKTESPELAKQAADAELAVKRREESMAYAGLVTARDGAADTAAVASAARDRRIGVDPQGRSEDALIAKRLEMMQTDMNKNHREASSVAGRHTFSRP
jgi:hypothetical protein